MTFTTRITASRIGPMVLAVLLGGALTAIDGAALAATSIEIQPSGKFEDAQKDFQSGNLRTSVIHLKNVLRSNPDHLPSRLLLGRIYLVIGDGESAEKELRRALDIGADQSLVIEALGEALIQQGKFFEVLDNLRATGWPKKVQAGVLTLRGKAHFLLRHLKDAEGEFLAALRIQPGRGSATVGLARVRKARGKWDEAEEFLKQATDKYPDMADAWYERGELERGRGKLRPALDHFSRAIAVQPRHLAARTYRAAVLIDMGAAAQAKGDLEYVRKYDPHDPHLQYWWARYLESQGQTKEAKLAIELAADQLRSMDPGLLDGDAHALVISSLIYLTNGDTDLAHTNLVQAIHVDAFNPFARKALGTMLNKEGRFAEAVGIMRPVVRLRPQDSDLIGALAKALLRTKRFTEANELLTQAIEAAPDRSDLQARLGMSQIGSGNRETGLAMLRETLGAKLDQVSPGVLLTMIHLRAGEFKEAVEAANLALESTPDDPELFNLLGAAHIGLGDRKTAIRNFSKALEINPKLRVPRVNLARLNMLENNLAAAERDFKLLLDRNEFDLNVILELSNIAARRKDKDEQVRWLEKAVAAAPGVLAPKIYLIRALLLHGLTEKAVLAAREARAKHDAGYQLLELLGRAELEAGNTARAANAFKNMLDHSRDSASAMMKVAQLQKKAADLDGALKTLSSAVVTFPTNTELLVAIIELEYQLGKTDRIKARIDDLLRKNPEKAIGWALLGDDHLRRSEIQEAVTAYEKAFELSPGAGLLVRIFLAGERIGQRPQLIDRMVQWAAQNPKDRLVRRTLVGAYIKEGRLNDAIAEAKLLLVDKPDSVETLNNLAWLYDETGNPQAREMAEKAYKLAPGNPSVIDTLGWLLVRQGETERGLALLRDAHARGGDRLEIRFHLAATLQRLGRLDEARKEMKAIISAAKGASLGDEFDALRKELGMN
ncbi:XrtA/PEP-CTERM system TPR-repeat protein PrsT [Magnetospira sp. QH-2]|uniref:XrtA/PEP-CTERM system TPR-repeat protein PrsT n=1 Tax=Magnetospira sp. (strain QH-2) TaxID=1288970 RepID=UPI0011DDAEE9|nr:XrtA/PEP-CTERM system TPR-repeat protein PrsT [Magnetospira sp. QH-2]